MRDVEKDTEGDTRTRMEDGHARDTAEGHRGTDMQGTRGQDTEGTQEHGTAQSRDALGTQNDMKGDTGAHARGMGGTRQGTRMSEHVGAPR